MNVFFRALGLLVVVQAFSANEKMKADLSYVSPPASDAACEYSTRFVCFEVRDLDL